MPDAHGMVIRAPRSLGMLACGVHEGLGAEQDGWDAAIFERQDVVHTTRHARASVADGGDDKVAAVGQFVDQSRLGEARINEVYGDLRVSESLSPFT
jgi:hypothetical protein